jgi:hypothetical protein
MGFFEVDFDKTIWERLAVNLRTAVRYAWLKVLCYYVKKLYLLFYSNRAANLDNLAHNSQVVYMQAGLNDLFDKTLRRIIVDDDIIRDPLWIYLEAEAKPVFIDLEAEVGTAVIPDPDPVPIYLEEEGSIYGVPFLVKVPVAVYGALDPLRLRAKIESLRLPGTLYKIVTF